MAENINTVPVSGDPVTADKLTKARLNRLARKLDTTPEELDSYNQLLSNTYLKSIGMSYPIVRGNSGFFQSTYNTLTNERIKLINLMNTVAGERYEQPTLGLELEKYLFEQNTDELRAKIRVQISNKIQYWLPSIAINSLTVNVTNADIDSNIITVTVTFSLVNNTNDTDTITFTFQ